MNKDILLCMLFLGLGQLLVWFQLNGQFVWKWFDKNPLILTLVGIPISYFFIIGTKYGYEGFGNVLWAQRLIGFAIGITCFAFCTSHFLGEGLTSKTMVSLALACTLVLIQVFWK
jgi:hypothetical protein|tara:strand:+ start:6862 stop:7206 length:345 start_codon:yes stop_codon:yes gene_type:complete